MRRIVWLLIIVSAAVGIALLLRIGNGNVAILWPPYRIDLSVNLAVLILLVLFLLLHLLFGALSGALNLPARVREYRERRQRERALVSLRDSLLAFLEGRFGRAERLAQRALPDAALAGTAALIGARAAQQLRDTQRRDQWLESVGDSELVSQARRMTQAEIALEEHRGDDALAALSGLTVGGQRHIHALRLALRAHEHQGNWGEVLDHVRQLENRTAIDPAAASTLRVQAIVGLLDAAGDDPEAVRRTIDEIPAPERELEAVQRATVRALCRAGLSDPAARTIEQALAQRYDAELVSRWAELDDIPGRRRLASAEGWLQQWGDQPALLAALGRLCAAEGLWGKAEAFLLRAERLGPDPVIQTLLAELCERHDRPEEAAQWYRQAALASVGGQAFRQVGGEAPRPLPAPEPEGTTEPPPLPAP
ncbi:MAG: heme biosynthesis HemY N-terminal domain-containing protein [Burkholderiaceae bacterium]